MERDDNASPGSFPAPPDAGSDHASAPDAAAVPVFSLSATDSRTGRWVPTEVERIVLPSALLAPTRFVTRMDSRALEPSIRLGAYLVVDMAQTKVPATATPGIPPASLAPFAVEVSGEGLVVRLVRHDPLRDRLELVALDSRTPALSVSCGNHGCQVVGRVVWTVQNL